MIHTFITWTNRVDPDQMAHILSGSTMFAYRFIRLILNKMGPVQIQIRKQRLPANLDVPARTRHKMCIYEVKGFINQVLVIHLYLQNTVLHKLKPVMILTCLNQGIALRETLGENSLSMFSRLYLSRTKTRLSTIWFMYIAEA